MEKKRDHDKEYLRKGFVSPNDAGVIGENDSQSIQNAVDAAVACGVGKVVIPKFNERTGDLGWEITKTILLTSGVTVVLDDCRLRMADDVYENFFRTRNLFTEEGLVTDRELDHIVIRGVGNAVLDGGNSNDLNEHTSSLKNGKPHVFCNIPILFFNVRYFSVENISIVNQRYWGMLFEYCKCGKIANIYVCAVSDRNNQDGINVRNGCHHLIVENVYGQTGDDMIALSALDSCKEGKYNLVDPAQDSAIHTVTLRNISGCGLWHPLVTLRSAKGHKIYDILIENLHDTAPVLSKEVEVNVVNGVGLTGKLEKGVVPERTYRLDFSTLPRYGLIRIGDLAYNGGFPTKMGDIHHITVNHVRAQYSERAIVLASELRDCRFTDIEGTGECRYAVGLSPRGTDGGPGLKAENLYVEGIWMDVRTEKESGALDFGELREGDYVKDMRVRNVRVRNASHIARVSKVTDIVLEDAANESPKGEAVKVCGGTEDTARVTFRQATDL